MLKIKIIILIIFQVSLIAKINTIVSISPQLIFLKSIGGDKINISLMVKPGNSPHTYSPKPSQMKDIAKANIYFAIGVEFEDIWLKKFKNQNHKMKVVDLSNGIQKVAMASHHHHNDKHSEKEKHIKTDPHIWTNPMNVKIVAKNIYQALIDIDIQNKDFYKKNLNKFLQEITDLDKKIKKILSKTVPNSRFMVFHPAWGYFAKQYNLKQFPVEIEGKSPKPKDLAYIIREAKEENIKAIFTQPEFSDKSANIIAKELNIKVIKTSPLSPNWSKNLIRLAKAISEQ